MTVRAAFVLDKFAAKILYLIRPGRRRQNKFQIRANIEHLSVRKTRVYAYYQKNYTRLSDALVPSRKEIRAYPFIHK